MRAPAVLRPFLPTAPLTGDDKWMIFLLWVTGVAMGWSQGEPSSLVPFTRADLGVTQGGMSLILAIARFAAFFAVFVGALADRIGRRRPLIGSLALLLVATGLSALAPDPVTYGAAQALARVGAAATSALAVVAMAEGVSPPVRAYAISFFGAAASLGSGISVTTLPLAESASWRLPHGLPAVLVVVLPFLWRRLPESPLLGEDLVVLPRIELFRGEWARRLALVGAIGLLSSAFTAVGLAFTTERLIGDLGYPATTTILVTVGGGTLGGLGFFVGGRLADAWGRRPTSILALSLALAGGLGLYAVTDLWMLWLAAFASSFGAFAYIPSGGAHRSELFPTSLRGYANTAANYFATVGSALGLLFGSVTIDRLGLFDTLALLGVGLLVATVLTALLPETLGTSLDDV